MLFFNKNKTVLKDLIPENHVDIHSHLLPGIDDGAQTIDDTLFLLDSLKNMGVSKFITTPHIFSGFWDNTKDKIQALELETNSNNNTSFKAAAEYLMDDHFISLFQKGEILTLKDNYVLVEMSYLNPPIQLFDIIFDLQIAGYKPVLAHPERYAFYHNNFDLYQKLKNAGCLFQLNLLSTVGYYGKEVAHAAEKLLKKGLIDFVGSDVHHKKHIDSFDKKILIKDLHPLKEAIANNQFFK
ncbi:Tyrosine-protein phosphatase YwqE [Flavobacterium swingsii]|jgi:protein-tyrosine phosphatase|uniref:protein-tyrosine-phosphatase n=1 Tax=Flavobacterium swingsii TaxID=498292 RepID=A0A1I0Z6C5_9FLAO|nr:CpsB/CapC family capsule biosynthesis tyrosine phosphatase [Flavobacterium swingsii]SFB20972.1 Tyrosine-protein phosphatase YwqE [Flavobacterium swingsii]